VFKPTFDKAAPPPTSSRTRDWKQNEPTDTVIELMVQQILASQWHSANQEIGPWSSSGNDAAGNSTTLELAHKHWPAARKFYLSHPQVINSELIQERLKETGKRPRRHFPDDKKEEVL
jgi:hypothetical protein